MTAPAEDRALASAISTQTVECVVEIPKGSRNKYEYDQELGAIKLDRFVSASVGYPTDYGFIPETLSLDGDPLDVMICVSEPTFPGCVVLIKPIALLEMEDEHGVDPQGWVIVTLRCSRSTNRADATGRPALSISRRAVAVHNG